jgi:hypothetical protein
LSPLIIISLSPFDIWVIFCGNTPTILLSYSKVIGAGSDHLYGLFGPDLLFLNTSIFAWIFPQEVTFPPISFNDTVRVLLRKKSFISRFSISDLERICVLDIFFTGLLTFCVFVRFFCVSQI